MCAWFLRFSHATQQVEKARCDYWNIKTQCFSFSNVHIHVSVEQKEKSKAKCKTMKRVKTNYLK